MGSGLLILGLGNDLLGDDAVGLLVARELAALFADVPEVTVRETMEMGLALLDEMAGFDAVILVDAVETGQVPPGTLHEFGAEALAGRRISAPHFVGVAETIGFGRMLGLEMPTQIRVFAIEVRGPLVVSTEITPAVRAAIPVAVEHILRSSLAPSA